MNPTQLPKNYKPRSRKPFSSKSIKNKSSTDYDKDDEDDEDNFVGNGMGLNFWLGVCNSLAILVIIGVCSFAVWNLGKAVYDILMGN